MDLGLITFGSRIADPNTGETISQRDRIEDVVDSAVLAEDMGYAWYAVGEHHFRDRDVIPNPSLVLAAIAQRTSRIRVATATTLVANRDPVLLAEDYALLDNLTGGRLELIAGASFFPEPYAVFDQAFDSRAARKKENLELLIELWTKTSVTWEGEFRPPLTDVTVQPRLFQDRPPLWVSSGTTGESIELAVDLGLPIAFGTTTRPPDEYTESFAEYRRLWQARYPDSPAGQAAASHLFVAKTSQEARSTWEPFISSYVSERKSKENLSFADYIGPSGPAICGSPAEVVDKLGVLHEKWGHDLHLVAVDIGGIGRKTVDAAVELLATDVLPHVREFDRAARVVADA